MPKKEGISWRIDSKSVYLQQKRRCDFWGMFRFDRDTHQIILKTEIASLAHGGPHYPLYGIAEKPVDYKGEERSQL